MWYQPRKNRLLSRYYRPRNQVCRISAARRLLLLSLMLCAVANPCWGDSTSGATAASSASQFPVSQSSAVQSSHRTNAKVHFSCLAPASTPEFNRLNKVYGETFAQLGYGFQMTALPEHEILAGFNTQRFDGDCARIPQYFNPYFAYNYDVIPTSVQQMDVNVYGESGLRELKFRQLVLATQPGSLFMRGLLKSYDISVAREINHINDVWPLLDAGKVHGLVAIGALFPAFAPAARVRLNDKMTLARFPVHVVLNKRLAHLRSPFERILRRELYDRRLPVNDDSNPAAQGKLTTVNDKDIVFSCPLETDNPVFKALIDGYTQAFGRLGYQFRMISMSRDREMHELLHNRVDGSCGRINFPENTAIRPVEVPISISDDNLEIWSTQAGPEIHSLSQLPPGSRAAYRQSLL